MLHELPMVFTSDGAPLAGTFVRDSVSLSARQRCIVVTGSWLTVKEQMALVYARALAERGFTAFTFDFSGWGESGGALRHWELPNQKARDMAAAIDFVSSLSFAGPKVGYLAVCASAQYALRAAAGSARIASLVMVAGWFHDAASVAPFYGGSEGVERRMARAREALAEQRRTGTVRMVPAYEAGNERAGMSFAMDYYANPERGAVPTWSNEMAEASWLHWLTFDGLAAASSVAVPTLFVHSDGCALPDNARTVHERLKGPKELAWMATGTQTDYYDLPEHVAPAAERAAAFFARTLGATERESMNADGEADRVRALVTRVAHEIDRKRWAELTNLFAPRVETDYTSLFGGAPQTQTREGLVAGWRAALERVATQHLLGPIDVLVEGSG